MKRLIIIVIAVALAATLAACGAASQPEATVTVTATPSAPAEPLFTEAEQEIIDYCSSNIDEMESILLDAQVTLDSSDYASYGDMGRDIVKLVKRYKRIEVSYNRTNGGDYAGGEVEGLEDYWERAGNNLRVLLRGMAQCLTDPDNVNTDRAARALVNAEDNIERVRDELETLTSY